MTGAVPGFVDVVLNFDTAELRDDNLLTQLRHAGKKIIFYGDETWIHLFPGMFTRYDGTTSFFVSDYTEVAIVCLGWTNYLIKVSNCFIIRFHCLSLYIMPHEY
jgi:ethanolaminephosphotransferase